MKRVYVKPTIEYEAFVPNEYVAACYQYDLKCYACSENPATLTFTAKDGEQLPVFRDADQPGLWYFGNDCEDTLDQLAAEVYSVNAPSNDGNKSSMEVAGMHQYSDFVLSYKQIVDNPNAS